MALEPDRILFKSYLYDVWKFIVCKITIVVPISELNNYYKVLNTIPRPDVSSINGAILKKLSNDSVK